jgi:PAS domain S-box-containing protein
VQGVAATHANFAVRSQRREDMAALPNSFDTPSSPSSERDVQILIVDDQPANLAVLEVMLQDLGHKLTWAHSGEEALRRLLREEFAVILLDVQMPGLDGFETAKLIRGKESTRHTPIVFLTGYDNDRFPVDRAYSLGAVDYLVKPLIPVILRAKVTGFVELFQKTQQVKQQAEQLRRLERREFEARLAEENGRLREAERRWRSLAEALPNLVWTDTPDGQCDYLSSQWGAYTGIPENELLGLTWLERVLHPDDRERTLACWMTAVADQGVYDLEYRIRRFDGQYRWFKTRGVPIRDEQGRIVKWFGTCTDIEDQKQVVEELRQSEDRFARFMQHLPGLAWVKDSQGRYVYANDAAFKAFRHTREELYGKTDAESFPTETAAQFAENDQRALINGAGVQVVETLEHEDGLIHHSIVSKFLIPDKDGKPPHVGGVAIDITELKRAEEALRETDRRKDEFLATLAHELRNPLAPIRNVLQILKTPTLDPALADRSREMMERQVHQLVRLVDDLLDVSRVMRGKIELRRERTDLAVVIARAAETAQPLIDAQGHKLELESPTEKLFVDADPIRLSQVIGNLLTNAAKYTEANGRIGLSARREEGIAVLRVLDNGIGIAPDMLPRVFDLFMQADHSTTKSHGGLGVGLTLVKNLVELHGGTVEARSAGLGQGSEFVIRLPLGSLACSAPMSDIDPEKSTGGVSSGRRLLVVDDNQDAAASLATLLQLQGHDVRTAYNGVSALELARSFRPEMIFLDIGMPEMDGYEVARRLRLSIGLENTVLTALTGWGQEEDRRRTAEAGFNHHLVKPLEAKMLENLLGSLRPPESP